MVDQFFATSKSIEDINEKEVLSDENIFYAEFDSSGVPSGENLAWSGGNAVYSGGAWQVPLAVGFFPIAPICFPTFKNPDVSIGGIFIQTETTLQIDVGPRDPSGNSGLQKGFNLMLVRRGADYRTKKKISDL